MKQVVAALAFSAATVVLWLYPFHGFHHHYAFGIFGWLIVVTEQGFEWGVNPFTLALTVVVYAIVVYLCLGAAGVAPLPKDG